MKKKLNPTLIYVLSIPAYIMAHNKVKGAELNPDDYEGDLKAMKTAKIVALVSAIISGLVLIRIIYVLATNDWDELKRTIEDAVEQAQQNQ